MASTKRERLAKKQQARAEKEMKKLVRKNILSVENLVPELPTHLHRVEEIEKVNKHLQPAQPDTFTRPTKIPETTKHRRKVQEQKLKKGRRLTTPQQDISTGRIPKEHTKELKEKNYEWQKANLKAYNNAIKRYGTKRLEYDEELRIYIPAEDYIKKWLLSHPEYLENLTEKLTEQTDVKQLIKDNYTKLGLFSAYDYYHIIHESSEKTRTSSISHKANYYQFYNQVVDNFIEQALDQPNFDGSRVIIKWIEHLKENYETEEIAEMIIKGYENGIIVTWEIQYYTEKALTWCHDMMYYLHEMGELSVQEMYEQLEAFTETGEWIEY